MGGLAVIVIIAAVLGVGIYQTKFQPFNETVIKVGNTNYSMDYYINTINYWASLTGNGSLLTDPQNGPYLAAQIEQMIMEDKVIVDGAAKPPIGITISDAEVNQAIKDRKLGSDQARKDAVRVGLLLDKMKTDYFDKTIVPAAGPQRQVEAMFLESQAQADTLIATQLNSGADFGQVAADNSLETNSKTKRGNFDWVPKGILPGLLNSTVLEDKVFSLDPAADLNKLVTVDDPNQSKTVGYWLVKYTETQTSSVDNSQQKHVFAMLLPDEAKALDIKKQLDNGGDFVELAKANSQYISAADNGGDLNFVSKGGLGDAVDAVLYPADTAAALPVNTLSNPIKDISRTTTGGVWLIKVTGADENRPITGDNRTTLVSNALNSWVNETWTAEQSTAQDLLTDTQRQFAISEAIKR